MNAFQTFFAAIEAIAEKCDALGLDHGGVSHDDGPAIEIDGFGVVYYDTQVPGDEGLAYRTPSDSDACDLDEVMEMLEMLT